MVLVAVVVACSGPDVGSDALAGDGGGGRASSTGSSGEGFSASVDISDPDEGSARVAWNVGSDLHPSTASRIVGYEVEIVVGGRSITDSPVPVETPFVDADLWAGFGRWDADVPFLLAVRAEFDDGTRSARLTERLVLPAIVPAATDWVTGAPETVVDDPASAHGLSMWVDGTIGFASLESGVRAFGANGPSVASWEVGEDRFVSKLNHPALRITGQDDLYAAGGPVHVHRGDPDVPSDDRLIMIYHGEDHRQALDDGSRWWGYLGMAVSDDGGETFVDAGKIVAPEVPVTDELRWAVEVGGGAFAIVEDGGESYFYVYFRDTSAGWLNRRMSVARATVDSVVSAAQACRPADPATCVAPRFAKYDGSGWSSAGVGADGTSGGIGADLFGSSPYAPTPIWFDVVEIEPRGLYVMLFSWVVPDDVPAGTGRRGWSYAVSVSTDGLDWSRPVRVAGTDLTHELVYVTLASADLTSARRSPGDELVVFRTRTEFGEPGPPGRWAGDVTLDRLTLSYRP